MAWGARRGVDDLVQKLIENKTSTTMCILSTRTFGSAEAVALARALTANTSLSELLASGHALGAKEASEFGRAMASNTTLRSLSLGDSEFGNEGVAALVEDGLVSNTGLFVLDLEYKTITSGEALSVLLQRHRTLVDLRLGRNQLAATGAAAISEGLRKNSTLMRLDLSGNLLDAVAAEALARALSPSQTSTTQAASTGEACDAEPDNSNDIEHDTSNCSRAARSGSPLKHLNLSQNPLGDEGGATILNALWACASLCSLSMTETGLGQRSASALAKALAPAISSEDDTAGTADDSDLQSEQRQVQGGTADARGELAAVNIDDNHSSSDTHGRIEGPADIGSAPRRGLLLLETLDVSKNEFGIAGAQELAGALARRGGPKLESLSMGYNAVGDEGAAALGRSARKGLKVLDLSGNALTGAGLQAAVSAPGLREAKLFHNACGDEGIPVVLEALIGRDHLETLDLGANGITGVGFEILLPGLAECPLQTLEVGANSNDDRAEAAVRQSQANNPGLDIAFRRGGEAMEGSGAPPGAAPHMERGSQLAPTD